MHVLARMKKQSHSLKIIMNRSLLLALALLFIHLSESVAGSGADSVNVAPFGRVYVYNPESTSPNVVIMISGDGGWKSGVVSFAREFSKMNTMVIGVDIVRYFKDLRQRPDDCYHVAADFVELVTAIEKKYNFPEYKPAILMGYSSGATLVYGILAQSRPGTFTGGISLGFCPDLELPKMLCETNGLTEKAGVTGKSYFLEPDARLGNHWIVLQGKLDKVCNFDEVADFVNKTTDAELIILPATGHGFSKWSDFMPQWKEAFTRLTEKHGKDQLAQGTADRVKNLPLFSTNAKVQIHDKPIALFISGDGGWYSFEQSIADKLADDGIPTIGLDSKKYFWKRRTPEQTAEDITLSLKYYSKEWDKDRFILIGYSLGAEIVPFIINRMPQEMKGKIVSSVLLSPDISTDFEIHISNMLGMGNRQNTYNVADEINAMQPVPTLIIFGSGEKTEVPDHLKGKGATIKKIPGDHHYKFDIPLIIKTIKDYKTF
jgi:type IV secretory pathway VirJ component